MKIGDDSLSTKDRLLAAALQQFSQYGFDGVSVPSIAKLAKVAAGSVYTHFSSKEDLANELYLHWKTLLKMAYLEGYPIEANHRYQFVFIWSRLHHYTDQHPMAFRFIEHHMHGSYLTQESLDLEEEIFEIGRSFIRSAQEAKVIRAMPAQVAVSFFFGAFVQYFKDCSAGREKWSLKNSELIRDLCWRALAEG